MAKPNVFADVLAVHILVDPKLTEIDRQAKLAALIADVCRKLSGPGECPHCGSDDICDNGASGDNRDYKCMDCGEYVE